MLDTVVEMGRYIGVKGGGLEMESPPCASCHAPQVMIVLTAGSAVAHEPNHAAEC